MSAIAPYAEPYKRNLDFTLSLYGKFLSVCPDNIWKEKFGGWPVCEQFYHAVISTARVLYSISGEEIEDPCPDADRLEHGNAVDVSKKDAEAVLSDVSEKFAALWPKLSDADLLKKNDPMSKMLGAEASNGQILEMMATHMQYHLGSCDAALREAGLEGAF